MNIQENISLKTNNTFGIDKKARFFVEVKDEKTVVDAIAAAKSLKKPIFILGGGSNILLTKDLDAFVIKINIKGIEVVKEDADHVYVQVGAGEVWHEFVLEAIKNEYAGVENLSLIPGTVGASPMQNIGAYGVEIQEVFDTLRAIEIDTGQTVVFDHKKCAFGYRESIFKHEANGKYIITSVTFKLRKQAVFNTSYGAIATTLESMGIKALNLKAISDAVIHIRQSKLPDPAKIGNAGSFFKNPSVDPAVFEQLQQQYPDIPGYPAEAGIKVPAAWLIEKAGWKGKTLGAIGVHKNQPLVLVNYGGGDGRAIEKLSLDIRKDIHEKFGILLQTEVNII